MTGKASASAKTATIPLVGDTLKAETTPETADVTYAWMADGVAIAGATDATYTVTASEVAKVISVKITAKDAGTTVVGSASQATTGVKAKKNLAAVAEITLPTDYAANTTAVDANPVKGTSFTAKVIDKTSAAKNEMTLAADKFDIQWYKNSVSTTTAIPGATSLTFNSYDTVKAGDTLIPVITGKGNADTDYIGTVQSAATPAVKSGFAAATVKDETGNAVDSTKALVVNTTLKASVLMSEASIQSASLAFFHGIRLIHKAE